ncbi:MAG: hypothetical protein JWM55_2043, partial [Acidimicrobiaceae bacterium]|nr:hypothetical protein [Acidimicrobiaceae bacterium]
KRTNLASKNAGTGAEIENVHRAIESEGLCEVPKGRRRVIRPSGVIEITVGESLGRE